jgi:predicted ATP-dependent Lon-type protease
MQTALGLCDELLCTSTQDQCAGLGSRAVGEYVETLAANLAFFKGAAGTEVAFLDICAG